MHPTFQAVDRLPGFSCILHPVSHHRRPLPCKKRYPQPLLPRNIPGTSRLAAALALQHNTAYLSSLLSGMVADGHNPGPEWFQSLYASTAASLPTLVPDQLATLLNRVAMLRMTQSPPGPHHIMRSSSELPSASEVPADWSEAFLLASEYAMQELSPVQVVSLLRSCSMLDIVPQVSWISAALQRVGR